MSATPTSKTAIPSAPIASLPLAPTPDAPAAETPAAQADDQGTLLTAEMSDSADAAGSGEAQGAEGANAESAGAPERYELQLPQGLEFQEGDLDRITETFKAANLTQEQAQGLVELHASLVQRDQEAWRQTITEWQNALPKDAEFGGQRFRENAAVAAGVVARFGTPELKQMLDTLGIGNHPELVRFCYRVGKSLAETKLPNQPGGAAPRERTQQEMLDEMYPSMAKAKE